MKKGWEIKKLGECFKLKSGDGLTRKKMNQSGIIPVFGGNGIAGYHDKYNISGNNIIVGRVGALCGNVRNINENIWLTDNAFKIVDYKYDFDKVFLTYLLNFKNLRNYARQAAQPVISNSSLKDIYLEFPKSLKEQQQIVAILDKAFSAVATAKANAEQNLLNTKQLFESYLQNVFENKGDDWEEKILGEVVSIVTGKLNANAMTENGVYPFFTCSRKIFAIDIFAFDCEAVLLAGNNASGDFNVKYYKGKFNAYQRTYVITIKNDNELVYSYLKHKLIHHLGVFKKQSVGANTKFLKLGMIKGVSIILPPLREQQKIVKKLNNLSTQTKKLEAIYQQKSNDLEELKKSILQKAFNGELT